MSINDKENSFLDAVVNGNLATQNNQKENQTVNQLEETSDKEYPTEAVEKITVSANDRFDNSSTPIDFNSELLKISNNEIKSTEDLKTLLERSRILPNLESKVKSYEEELLQLKEKVTADPFANEYIKKLNSLYKEGASESQIEAYQTLNKVGQLENLDPKAIRKLALQLKKGLTSEEAELLINDHYKLDPELYDESTVSTNKVRLKVDAKEDLEHLQHYKAELSQNPVKQETQAIEHQKQDYLQRLEPIVKDLQKEFSSIKDFSLNSKDGDQLIELPVSEHTKSQLEMAISHFATVNSIPLNGDGLNGLKEFATRFIWANDGENIARHIAAKTEERIREEYHNPSPIDRGEDHPDPGLTTTEKILAWAANK